MKILFSPQIMAKEDQQITYEFGNDVIIATIGDVTDIFDFSGLPDGIVDRISDIETTLPVNPIQRVERIDGVLYVTLLKWLPEDTPEEEMEFDWMEV
jgi:hypothetical protein